MTARQTPHEEIHLIILYCSLKICKQPSGVLVPVQLTTKGTHWVTMVGFVSYEVFSLHSTSRQQEGDVAEELRLFSLFLR